MMQKRVVSRGGELVEVYIDKGPAKPHGNLRPQIDLGGHASGNYGRKASNGATSRGHT